MSTIDYEARYKALAALINNDEGFGIFPQGHLTQAERESITAEKSDAYRCGWNDYAIKHSTRLMAMVEEAEAGMSDDLALLLASEGFHLGEDGKLSMNMNDTWAWASSWSVAVCSDQVAEVASLFRTYGRAGLMYWHSCQENDMRSEFHHYNRAVEFVRNEERIRKETPGSSELAYRQVEYVIGAQAKTEGTP